MKHRIAVISGKTIKETAKRNMVDYYEAAYELWIKCGNGLNDKDDSREGIDPDYLK